MDAQGFCHYVHADKCARNVKEGSRTKEGSEATMNGKRKDEKGSGGTGERK